MRTLLLAFVNKLVHKKFAKRKKNDSEVEILSTRERQVLELVVRGLSNKEIAGELQVTLDAIRWHLKHIYRKLDVHCRTNAALKFRVPYSSRLAVGIKNNGRKICN